MICSSVREDTPKAYNVDTPEGITENSPENDTLTYIANQSRALHNRRLFLTSKGYYGVGHNSLEPGDVCAVFRGANVPFILRAVSPDEQSRYRSHCYKLVGEAYIQGIMNGEVFKMLVKEPVGIGGGLAEVIITVV